jgi:hypothetical protein
LVHFWTPPNVSVWPTNRSINKCNT